ncbi:hypothetical protein [Mucilaginibacter xinganensis]|uniref:Uncharacterized protein n=1 Tax=Mucilaginibacter xinganensis TaxID=1234841 RepID=A0A223P3A9_9SPHI|nr:hypothetical protein [Mucilaginibacter xinganensis]ASU36454.1 hypothetical protein MuYL_4569 [Mucilaginibacter xinganensis]
MAELGDDTRSSFIDKNTPIGFKDKSTPIGLDNAPEIDATAENEAAAPDEEKPEAQAE